MASKLTPPFKGRPASDLLQYIESVFAKSGDEETSLLQSFSLVVSYLLEIDADCCIATEMDSPTENPTGLTPSAMTEKMDILLQSVFTRLDSLQLSEHFYLGFLTLFEETVLKLQQPHYVQFIALVLAASSKERADSFLSLLLNLVHDDSADPIGRREAIGYAGSFACRAGLLGCTHSARVGKYLSSFMVGLDLSRLENRRLLVLCLQTICYMACWESERWDPNSMELDWVSRSKRGLVAFLLKTKKDGHFNLLRLVPMEMLQRMRVCRIGRLSVVLKTLVEEAISEFNELLPPVWKPVPKAYFPFDNDLSNLTRCGALIKMHLRQNLCNTDSVLAEFDDWPLHREKNLSDTEMLEFEPMMEDDEEVWCFREISAAFGSPNAAPAFSPIMGPADNIVLSRILSSKSFAPF